MLRPIAALMPKRYQQKSNSAAPGLPAGCGSFAAAFPRLPDTCRAASAGDRLPLETGAFLMTTFVRPSRLLLLAAAALLAGCGGGGGEAGSGPSIAEFSADRPGYFVGDSAQLRVRYAGGAGRVDPGIGSVGADATVGTGVLERSTAFRLTVTGGGGSATREVVLPVAYRDRHRPVAELQIAEHAAAALDDGTVLVIGGSRAELKTPSYWIERIDPRAGTVTRVGQLAAGRQQGEITALGNGRWLLSGGSLAQWIPGHGAEVVAVGAGGEVRVSGAGDMTHPRLGHAATLLADGRVLVTGGFSSGEGSPAGISRSAEIWDPASGRFRLLPATMAAARADHTATRLPDGKVLVVGGYSVEGNPPLAEVFDPASETFAPLATPGLASRAAHAAVALAGGDVLILGGENPAGTVTLDSVLRYRHDTRAVQPLPGLLAPRRHAAAVATADGEVLLFGGAGGDGAPAATAERYSPARGASAIATMPAGRLEHSAVLLRGPLAGKVLLVGGWRGDWYNATVSLYE
jgi:hypothetical protein